MWYKVLYSSTEKYMYTIRMFKFEFQLGHTLADVTLGNGRTTEITVLPKFNVFTLKTATTRIVFW